jgi:hypothetical protein
MISVASSDCFSRVSASWINAGPALPAEGLSSVPAGGLIHTEATRTGRSRMWPSRRNAWPSATTSSPLGGGTSRSPANQLPSASSTWK